MNGNNAVAEGMLVKVHIQVQRTETEILHTRRLLEEEILVRELGKDHACLPDCAQPK